MATPRFDTIPTPDGTPEGLLKTLQAVKAATEQLVGTQGNVGVSRTFVQQDPPAAVAIGDVWIKSSDFQDQIGSGITQSDGVVTSVWNGTKWVTVAVAGCFYEMQLASTLDFSTGGEVLAFLTPKLGAAGQVWKATFKGTFTNASNAMSVLSNVYADQTIICPSFITTAAANFGSEGVVVKVAKLIRPTPFAVTVNNLTAAGHGLLNAPYSTFLCERLS